MFRRLSWLWWTLLWLGLWIIAVVLGSIAVSNAYADHDGNDEPWRQPLLIACLPHWDYGSTRVVVDRPGYPQHGKTLHDQPFEVRVIFYAHWFRDTEDARAVDAHLIQWRREYECTHPFVVDAGGDPQSPKGGGREVRVGDGPTPPPGYPTPTPAPTVTVPPTETPIVTPAPTVTQRPREPSGWKWHCHQREGRQGGNGGWWYGYVVACSELITQPCDESPHDITCDYGRHHRHLGYTHESPRGHCHGC